MLSRKPGPDELRGRIDFWGGTMTFFERLDRNWVGYIRNSENFGRTTLHRKADLHVSPSGKIAGPGHLVVGKRWPAYPVVTTKVAVCSRSVLSVEGKFEIHSGCLVVVDNDARLALGSGYINSNSMISCFNDIRIGHDVSISERVIIRDSDSHRIADDKPHAAPIKIGNHVWIGLNVTILKGVEIGDGAVIAAGAVVTRSVPAQCLAAGIPARVIRGNVSWI